MINDVKGNHKRNHRLILRVLHAPPLAGLVYKSLSTKALYRLAVIKLDLSTGFEPVLSESKSDVLPIRRQEI